MTEFSIQAGGTAWDQQLLLIEGASVAGTIYHNAVKLSVLGYASCSGDRLIKPDFPVDIEY